MTFKKYWDNQIPRLNAWHTAAEMKTLREECERAFDAANETEWLDPAVHPPNVFVRYWICTENDSVIQAIPHRGSKQLYWCDCESDRIIFTAKAYAEIKCDPPDLRLSNMV